MASGQKHRLDPLDLNNAQYLTLDFYPLSEEAHALGAKLHELIMGSKVKKKGPGRPPNDAALANAALLIVAEIIDVAKGNLDRTVHHGLSPNVFSGKQVSHNYFTTAMSGLEKHKLLRKRKGSYGHKSRFSDAENPGVVWGYNTRWHPTQKLIELCESFSITHRNIESHFEIMLPRDPIMLRESSRGSGRNKVKGRTVTYPKTTTTEGLKSEINEINEFLKGFKLTGATHRGYRRIYNQGDDLETYKWDKGGRLYGSGDAESYLVIKKAERKKTE